MSSILTALKKLETETAKKTDTPFPFLSKVDRTTSTAPTEPGISRFLSVTIFLFAGIGILTVGWIAIDRFSPLSGETAVKGHRSVRLPTLPDRIETGASGNHAPLNPPKIHAAKNLQSIHPPSAKNQRKESVSPEEPEVQPKKLIPRETGAPGTGLNTVLQWTDNNRLSLQAIAWSDDPEERMVVINNKIIREGQPVDGIRVVRIDADLVILEEKGQRYKLPFN